MGSTAITRRAWLLLAGLLLLLAIPRLWGNAGGLPGQTEPDGLVIATQAQLLRTGADPGAEPLLWGFYPHLTARLSALRSGPRPVEGLEAQRSEAGREYASVRETSAWLSLLIVPLSFLLARRWLEERLALLVAGLSGASLLHLWFAVQARPHALLAVLALASVLAALSYAAKPGWARLSLLAVLCGLALGTLANGVFTLLPALLALYCAHGFKGWWRAAVLAGIAGSLAVAFHPFAIPFGEATGPALGLENGQFLLFGHRIDLALFRGAGFLELAGSLWRYDLWLAVLAMFALALSPWGRRAALERREIIIVLAFVIPYLLVFGLYGRTYQRFLLPLLPFVALFIGWSLSAFSRARWVVWVALAPQLLLSLQFARLHAAPTTIDEASAWVARELDPAKTRIAFLPSFELPLPYSAAALERNAVMLDNPQRPWFRYQSSLAPQLRVQPGYDLTAFALDGAENFRRTQSDTQAWLTELSADYFVVEVYTDGRKPLALANIHPTLPALATRVARFAPGGEAQTDNWPLTYSDDEYPHKKIWALELLRAERMGPVIEIWKRGS
ncbi:MAG: hypothetical protein ACKO32_08770 [Planctomycetia bacterium]